MSGTNGGSPPSTESVSTALPLVVADLPMLARRFIHPSVAAFFPPEEIAREAEANLRKYVAEKPPSPPGILEQLRRLATTIVSARAADAARRVDRIAKPVEDSVLEHVRQDGRTPSRAVGKEEAKVAVQECLARLDDAERELVWLRLDRGLTFPEIADLRGVTVGQVDGQFRRVLKKLAEMLGPRYNFQLSSGG